MTLAVARIDVNSGLVTLALRPAAASLDVCH
jgi:hypothetical protein